jgi:hypothetical protein
MNKVARYWLIGIVVVVTGIWLTKYVSETEMRRLDKEVDRLCAIDGRSVVYETVKLPAGRFQMNGRAPIPPNGRDDVGFGYYVKSESKTLAGPGQAPGAQLLQRVHQVVRASDGKIIAEHLYYTRSGGNWLEGVPGIGDGRSCPGPYPMDFLEQIFTKE